MKLDINDNQMVLARVMLHSGDAVKEIAETPEWKDGQTLTAEMTINGVSVPAEAFESFMHDWGKQTEILMREKYDADRLDQVIDDRAREILKTEAAGLIDKLQDLSMQLDDVDSVIRPHWER